MLSIKLKEAGYEEALKGISLSYNRWKYPQDIEKLDEIAIKLSRKSGGHDKHLEFIQTWWEIHAPRLWWQEFDTYRIGVSRYSESTMHTIHKRSLRYDDFEFVTAEVLENFNNELYLMTDGYTKSLSSDKILRVKSLLPEGFIQTRIVTMNYKAMKNIIHQRKNHKLKLWKDFITEIAYQVDHPLFLFTEKELEEEYNIIP